MHGNVSITLQATEEIILQQMFGVWIKCISAKVKNQRGRKKIEIKLNELKTDGQTDKRTRGGKLRLSGFFSKQKCLEFSPS